MTLPFLSKGNHSEGDISFWASAAPLCTLRQLREDRDVTRAISRDLGTMHGVPAFRDTRVPVQTLFEYLEGGDTLEDFLEGFPMVSRSLALEAFEEAKQLLLASAWCGSLIDECIDEGSTF